MTTKDFEQTPIGKELGKLVAMLADADPGKREGLNESQTRRLHEILRSSDEALEYYVLYLHVDSELKHSWGAADSSSALTEVLGTIGIDAAKSAPPASTRLRWVQRTATHKIPAWLSVCAAAGLMAFAFLWGSLRSRGPTIAVPQIGAPVVADTRADTSGQVSHDNFIEFLGDSRIRSDAALIVHSEGTRSSSLSVGRRLKPGILKFDHGKVQLEFFGGAIVALAGPTELHLSSKDFATLVHGKATANVPLNARGFVLNSPDAAVVDLGTEFSLVVNERGKTEVEVLSGEVELSLLGSDGAMVKSQRMNEHTRIRVDGDTSELVSIPSDENPAIAIETMHAKPLNVPRSYVQKVKDEKPEIYWRFEVDDSDAVANEMGELCRGALHGLSTEAGNEKLIQIVNGHLRFSRGKEPRYVLSEKSIQDLGRGDNSIEVWFNTNDLQHATFTALLSGWSNNGDDHFETLEIVSQTNWVHEPGAFRFLHRSPPNGLASHGFNLFSPSICIPGRWHHLVAVRDSTSLKLYVDGRLIRELSCPAVSDPNELKLLLGQVRFVGSERQFSGAIDEVAVYRHALSPDTIREHFDLLSSANAFVQP
jgi:hypothetical protein